MTPLFAGIGIFTGARAAVVVQAEKFQKAGPAPCTSFIRQQDDTVTKIVLTGEDTVTFFKRLSTDVAPKAKFDWLHPFTSLRTQAAELEEIQERIANAIKAINVPDANAYGNAIECYAHQYKEKDIEGKPVLQLQV